MSITVRSSGIPLDLVMATLLTADEWQEIGELAKLRIVERTAKGIGPDGQRWPPYSPAYAKRKAKALGPGPVNLSLSGRMLDEMRVTRVGENFVELSW